MSIKKIVIGWDDLGRDRNRMFLERISSILLSIGGLTDKKHIKLFHSKEELDEAAGDCDIIITYEKINGTPMSQGAIKKWRNLNPDIRVLLLVSDERKSTGKMKGLYDIGYMDALYYSDFEDEAIEDFIEGSRSEKTAYDYYGLDDYQDPLDKEGESVKKSKKAAREEALRDEMREKALENTDHSRGRRDADSVDRGNEREEDGEASIYDDGVFDGEESSIREGGAVSDGSAGHPDDAADTESTEDGAPKKRKRRRKKKAAAEPDPFDNTREDYERFFKGDLSGNAISSAEYSEYPAGYEADEEAEEDTEADDVNEADGADESNGEAAYEDGGDDRESGYGEYEDGSGDGYASGGDYGTDGADYGDAGEAGDGYIEGYEGYYDPSYNPTGEGSDDSTGDSYGGYDSHAEDFTGDERESFGTGNDNELSMLNYAPEDKTAQLREIDFSDFEPSDGPVNKDGKIVPFAGQKPDGIYDWIKHKTSEAVDGVRVEPYREKRLDREKEQVLMHYLNEDSTLIEKLEHHLISSDKFQLEVAGYIASNFSLSKADATEVYRDFHRFMYGYDILEPLILDSDVTDIKCYEPNNVRVKRLGGREEAVNAKFRSEEHYRAFVAHIAKMNHASVSGERAIVKFEDVKTYDAARLRVNISTEFINASGFPFVQIRKESTQKKTTEELMSAGMFTPRTAAYLVESAQNDSGIVFTGKGSAGKTTVMNWLIDYIPKNCSGLCIQEMDELFSTTHPDILFQRMAHIKRTEQESLLTSGAIGQDDGNYDLKNLSINGLLIDIDYFIIGEIKGPEAKYFLNAAYTGNKCWCSVHSPSSRQALHKIADYAKYESDYSREVLLQMLSSLHTVVFLKNFRVAQISEVVGFSEKTQDIVYRDVELDERKCYMVVP